MPVDPTPFSPDRAAEIWEQRGVQHDLSHAITPGEDAYVHQIWETLPGHCSWMSAFLMILSGEITGS